MISRLSKLFGILLSTVIGLQLVTHLVITPNPATRSALVATTPQTQSPIGGSAEGQVKGKLLTKELVLSKGLHRVTRVIDGDTIQIDTGDTVRYIGIDTPETNHPRKGVECFGKEAKLKNTALVLSQFVRLEKDISETDRYGRLLRYVFLESDSKSELFINEALARQGYARVATYPPDIKYQDLFLEAEQAARQNKRGLWSKDTCNGQTTLQTHEVMTFPTVPAPTGNCKIKGNISYTTGEKIFHTSNCPDYSTTKINAAKGEKYFCSEAEALNAGWRKAKNCP